MVPEATLEETEHGLVPQGEGWYVLNARDAAWGEAERRGAVCDLEGEAEFAQVGINIRRLGPGETIGLYHWEANQENFLVLSGEALLLVEGEERPLRQWDFVHTPAGASHIVLGAGEGCVLVAIGARADAGGPWGGYTVDPVALRHGAGVERETSDADEAYADFPPRRPARYREGWLPG